MSILSDSTSVLQANHRILLFVPVTQDITALEILALCVHLDITLTQVGRKGENLQDIDHAVRSMLSYEP